MVFTSVFTFCNNNLRGEEDRSFHVSVIVPYKDLFFYFPSFLIIPLFIIVAQRYLPGKERKSPYYLETVLRLPPQSITKFSIEMDYSFLKWQEYPPDANHGFYMGSAIITALLPIARNYTALPHDGSTITSRFNLNNIINNTVYVTSIYFVNILKLLASTPRETDI